MRTLVLSAAVLAAAAAAVTPASAQPTYRSIGGCSYNSVALPGSAQYTGAIAEHSVSYRNSDLTPVDAVHYCEIRVNGVPQGQPAAFAGYAVQGGVSPVSFVATDTDYVQLCERIVYAGGAEEDPWSCLVDIDDPVFPPQEVWDAVHELLP
jgi:hypothetical protein